MRTKHLACLFAALATLVTVSCKKEDKTTKFAVVDKEVTVPATPATGKIAYTLENPIDGEIVRAESESTWLHDFAAADGTITFSFDQNFEEERSSKVIVTYSTFTEIVTVKQMAADQNIATDPTELSFVGEGEALKVKVLSARNWTLTGESDWVTPDIKEGAPEAEITFTAAMNESLKERSAEFELHLFNSTNVYKLAIKQVGAKPVSLIKDPNFKAFMLAAFDKNKDGDFSADEMAASGAIEYDEDNDGSVTTFAGVELFPNITKFKYTTPYSNIKSTVEDIDLSNNKALTTVQVSNCKVKTVNLKGLSEIVELSFNGDTSLRALDLSSCTKLKEFRAFNSGLEALDFSKAPKLEVATIYGTKLETIDFSHNPEVSYVNADDINTLKTAIFKNNDKLSALTVGGIKLESVSGIENLPGLTELSYSYCPSETLNLGNAKKLAKVNISYSDKLKSLDIHKNTRLIDLTLTYLTACEELIIYKGQKFANEYIIGSAKLQKKEVEREVPSDIAEEIADSNLKAYLLSVADADKDGKITADEAAAITELNFSGKKVSSILGLEWFVGLRKINASNNEIVDFDASVFSRLVTLDVSNNKIKALNISGTKCENLYASNNQIESFTFKGYDLCYVDLSHNELSGIIEFKSQYYLSYLNLSDNKLKGITCYGLYSLADLDISNNNVQYLNKYENGLYLTYCNYLQNFKANNFGATYDLAHVLEGKNQLKTVELKGVDFSASKTDKIYININMDEDGTTPLPGTLTNLDVTGAKGLTKVYVGAKAVIEDANFKHDAGVELVRANK